MLISLNSWRPDLGEGNHYRSNMNPLGHKTNVTRHKVTWMTHHSSSLYKFFTNQCSYALTRLYRPLCNNNRLLWYTVMLNIYFLSDHLRGNVKVGNASHARWLCFNFMLLCSSFLDVSLLLQQNFYFLQLPKLTSTGNKPGQMWQGCHSATAKKNSTVLGMDSVSMVAVQFY